MGAARAAGVHGVGVTWGGIYRRDALSDAAVVVDSPEELRDVL
jgi:phosphoglycolate phosphatase-like HAD superfamily hydrolase